MKFNPIGLIAYSLFLIAVTVLLAVSTSGFPNEISGNETHVADGDTIRPSSQLWPNERLN